MSTLIHITEHAFMRAKERLSLCRKSFGRLAEKAYEIGIKHSDVKGRLKKYIDSLYFEKRSANNTKIYGDNIFLFSDNRLITVYRVPQELQKYIKVFKH